MAYPLNGGCTMADRIMPAAEVARATGLSRTTIWRMERDGKFPARRQVHGHRVGWLESEVDAWIQARPLVGAAA
jgi:prophage regulatory protein